MSYVDIDAANAAHRAYLDAIPDGPDAADQRMALEQRYQELLARHGHGPSDRVYEVARADTDKQIAALNVDDPSSAVYKRDRKSTRLNSSHVEISYAVFCLKKKNS